MSDMVNVHAKYWKMIGDLDSDKTDRRERIKQLEKELMEVKNKHSVLVADVVLYEDRADRIKRLEEFVEQLTNPKFTRDDLPKEALLQYIKRLEEAGDRMRLYCADPDDCFAWDRARKDNP